MSSHILEYTLQTGDKTHNTITAEGNAETVVQQFYEEQDYHVLQLNPRSGASTIRENTPPTLQQEMENIAENNFHTGSSVTPFWLFNMPGVPDFFVYSKDCEAPLPNYFFVEVKDENDQLRQSQIRWMAKAACYPIRITYRKSTLNQYDELL